MDYDYSKISELEKSYLPSGFQGNVYNLSYKWHQILPASDKPLKVLEIGAYQGANACSLVKTFCKHPKSEIHCIDPWADYEAYNEYKQQQDSNYSIFLKNISKLDSSDVAKIHIHRMSSAHLDRRFDDNFFDIIYIDGNHSTFYVLQDAIQSLKKLVSGGYLIFDDIQDPEVAYAVKMFISVAKDQINLDIKSYSCQVYVRKL
jgi:predicted O-methyltransferase YrrM